MSAWLCGTFPCSSCQLFNRLRLSMCLCVYEAFANLFILTYTTLNLCQPVWEHAPCLFLGSREQQGLPGSHRHCRDDWCQFSVGGGCGRPRPSQGRHHMLEMRYTEEWRTNREKENICYHFDTSFEILCLTGKLWLLCLRVWPELGSNKAHILRFASSQDWFQSFSAHQARQT